MRPKPIVCPHKALLDFRGGPFLDHMPILVRTIFTLRSILIDTGRTHYDTAIRDKYEVAADSIKQILQIAEGVHIVIRILIATK